MSKDHEVVPLLYDNDLEVGSYESLPREEKYLDEHEVPQGRHLGIFSTTVLFISRMVGSGIFSTPSNIFVSCGGNSFIFFTVWLLTALFAYAGLYIFLEFGYHLPRSGGRKVFLEHSFRHPKLLMSVTVACYSIFSGVALSGSVVFGKYFLAAIGYGSETYNAGNTSKYISIGFVVLATAIHGISVRSGIYIQNALGVVKLMLILMMCLTGFYAIMIYDAPTVTQWDSPFFSFQNKSAFSLNSLASAFISAFFCFAGWDSVHSVTSEVKNPARTLKISGLCSLAICALCYTLMNVAYTKVLSYEEIANAGPLVGSVLFKKLFGAQVGGALMTGSVAVSAASNVIVVIYGISRVNQEIFREGYLPFSKVLARNWPWDAPLFSLLTCALLTCTWIIILPSEGSSFNYLISVEGYGNQVFLLLVAVGLLLFRRQMTYQEHDNSIKASTLGVYSMILLCTYLVVGPFFGDQSANKIAFLPPYEVASVAILLSCVLFWFVKFIMLPFLFNYRLVSKTTTLSDGLRITEWKAYY